MVASLLEGERQSGSSVVQFRAVVLVVKGMLIAAH